jgi:hypothetical protein
LNLYINAMVLRIKQIRCANKNRPVRALEQSSWCQKHMDILDGDTSVSVLYYIFVKLFGSSWSNSSFHLSLKSRQPVE